MSSTSVEAIANAVLYEGYILYPYRPALKNRQRWTFGGLYPRSYSEAQAAGDAWSMQTECLLLGMEQTRLDVKVRFLHLMNRTAGELLSPLPRWPGLEEPKYQPVETLHVGRAAIRKLAGGDREGNRHQGSGIDFAARRDEKQDVPMSRQPDAGAGVLPMPGRSWASWSASSKASRGGSKSARRPFLTGPTN